jgi:hypothetical protein
MLFEILKLVNEELLYQGVILSNITLVYKVLLISANILLVAAGAGLVFHLAGAFKKEEEK